jgi:stage IV sporulation protein FB
VRLLNGIVKTRTSKRRAGAGAIVERGWTRLVARLPIHRMHAFGAPIQWRPGVLGVVLVFGVFAYQSIGAWIGLSLGWVVVMLVHELGHAYVARKLEYDIDLIVIGGFHGRCEFEAPEYEWHDCAIAWAGVAAQVAVAVPAALLLWSVHSYLPAELQLTLFMLSKFNVVVACFNLLPLPGFDGRIAWRVIPLSWDWWRANRATKRALSRFSRRRR